jgi:soluble lytic murein transglycosylase
MSGRRHHRRRLYVAIGVALVVVIGVVGFLLVSGRVVLPGLSERVYPIHYEAEIQRAAGLYEVDPYLVAAVVHTESGYDPDVVSHAGATGLMQLMPDTATWITKLDRWKGGKAPKLTDPRDNIELGVCYLSYLLDRFKGDTVAALAAYNAGHVNAERWLSAAGENRPLKLADITFTETRNFVARVESRRSIYKRVYPKAFTAGAGGT